MAAISLEGKTAVVTGAGRGIGRAIALALAAYGANVIVNDLGVALDGGVTSDAPAQAVVAEIRAAGGEATANLDSVATMDGGAAVIATAIERYGRVDSLICAAGILRPATIFEMTEGEWDDVMTTNVKGHFTTIKPAAVAMRDQGSGSIMTFTSTGGLQGNPRQPNYSAAKEAIVGLTRAVALSLAPYATCNAIAPSARTRMTDRMLPAGRTAPNADMVAPLAVFLASDQAQHITGQVLAIGGDQASIYPQPRPVRSAFRAGGWTPEALAEQWDRTLGHDKLVRYDRYVDGPEATS